jgi:hypothetical protein
MATSGRAVPAKRKADDDQPEPENRPGKIRNSLPVGVDLSRSVTCGTPAPAAAAAAAAAAASALTSANQQLCRES